MSQSAPSPAASRDFIGHPIGLYVLALTETWERFCYYGMRALLVLYMTKFLFLPEHAGNVVGYHAVEHGLEAIFGKLSTQALSSQIYGLYTGLVYLTPLAGGMIADRYWGQRKTVLVGGVIMAIGEFVMMVPSLFYAGLILLIIGNGAFKPNISTQVGALYPKGDPRRDRAYNIFYVGINLGAFIAPFICGTLGERYGWGLGFGSAGVGMIGGLIFYLWGQKYLAPDLVMARTRTTKDEVNASGAPSKSGSASGAVAKFTKDEWGKILALVALCLLNVPFWAVYEQQGNTLALWADGNTNRQIFGFLGSSWEIPATWFQAVNPFFIGALTPFINMLWERQQKKGTEPSGVTKMALGCGLLGISFLIMIGGARAYASGQLASVWWLVGCTFLLTVGEIYISPVGLSLVTKISPPRIVSMMMGFWLMSSFGGNYLCGYLGTFWEKMSKEAFFILMAGIAFAAGIAMVALFIPLKKAIGNENGDEIPTPAE